jgi:hypothetical protein
LAVALATIRDPRGATLYLLVFGLGTVAGLMLITAAVRVPFVYTLKRLARVNRYLGHRLRGPEPGVPPLPRVPDRRRGRVA